VNVVAPRTLRAFWERHSPAEAPLKAWQKLMQSNGYANWVELRNDFASADYISDRGLTIFNIGGNKYRLVTFIRYESQTVFIKHVFTHAEYDKWNQGGRP
jgi:mRNA interferase HigB